MSEHDHHLHVQNVSRRFGPVAALDGVSLGIKTGQIACLVGHSGCGKSTLLRAIAGVEQIDGGEVRLGGRIVSGAGHFIEPEDRNVGFMFQDYALFPHLTAQQNIGFGLRRLERAQRRARIQEVIERLGISRLADRYPHQLSGGEQQRIALARALAPQPSVLLMDEPFSNLDRGLRDTIRRETVSLIRTLGITAVIVTHDPEEALSTGDVVALMHGGRIVQAGSSDAIYLRPRTAYAAAFFSRINRIPARRAGALVESIFGTFPAGDDCPVEPVLYLRPQALELGANGVPAKVLQRVFMGEMEELSLAVEGLDAPLTLRVAAPSGAQEGQSVAVSVKQDQVLIFEKGEADELVRQHT